MTQQPPIDDPGDVVITGQRRSPGGSFPSPGGGGGIPGDDGGIHQEEVDPDPEDPSASPPHPCDDPQAAKIWNADAAAAAAAAALIAKAASLNDGSTLGNREFGAQLYLGLNNSVQVTPVSVGDPAVSGQIPSVDIAWFDANPGNWMGDIHNHPSGDGRLSDGEWTNFINFLSSMSATNPERLSDLAHISVYIVVLDPSSPNGYRIHAYNRDTPYDTLGQEVNPDAQPCPNT